MEATRERWRSFGRRRKRQSHSLLFSKATLQATLHRNRSDKTSIRVIRNDSRFPRPEALTGKVTERGKVIHPRKRFGECAGRVRAGAGCQLPINLVSRELRYRKRSKVGFGDRKST